MKSLPSLILVGGAKIFLATGNHFKINRAPPSLRWIGAEHMAYSFKLILFGDGGVGKTTLVERYVNGTFNANTKVTIGVQFLFKRLKLNDNILNLQIWDLGGEDRFRFIFPGYCNKTNGGIFVFDVTAPDSLYHFHDWMEIVSERKASFPVIFVGTKTDLISRRLVKRAEITKIAREYKIPDVVEISSKTGRNVEFAFEALSKLIIDCLAQKSITRAKPRVWI